MNDSVVSFSSPGPVGGVQIEISTTLSLSHISMAKRFAEICRCYDNQYKFTQNSSSVSSLTQGYASSTAILATAFLEANINEIYCDIYEMSKNGRTFAEYNNMDRNKFQTITALWEMGTPRTASYKILDKYDYLLTLLNFEALNKGATVYQNANLLVTMRNQLIHYESEWNVAETSESAVNDQTKKKTTSEKFQDKFRGKFENNTFQKGASNPFFPSKCLGKGFAVWAVESSIAFTDEFYRKICITPKYEHIREALKFN